MSLNLLITDLGLTWVIEDEVLKITNRLRVAGGLTVQVYRLSEVQGSEANQVERVARIKELIMATIAPDSWREVGGSGHISVVPVLPGGPSLVIRQTETIHAQIQILLRSLHRLMSGSASEVAVTGANLRTLHRSGKISAPIVELPIRKMLVVDSRIETPRVSSTSGLRPIRSGRPLEVGSGSEQAPAVTALPTVDLKGGVYIDRSLQPVAMATRNYAIGSKLLQRFRAAGDSNADAAKKLAEYIRSSINPSSWDAGGMEIMTNQTGEIRLVISHTPVTRDRMRLLFERLEVEMNAKKPDEVP